MLALSSSCLSGKQYKRDLQNLVKPSVSKIETGQIITGIKTFNNGKTNRWQNKQNKHLKKKLRSRRIRNAKKNFMYMALPTQMALPHANDIIPCK